MNIKLKFYLKYTIYKHRNKSAWHFKIWLRLTNSSNEAPNTSVVQFFSPQFLQRLLQKLKST